MTAEHKENQLRAYQRETSPLRLFEEVLPPWKRPKGRGGETMIAARERLANLQKELEKAAFPKEPLGLKKAAKFLREIGPNHYPSPTTLEKYIKITSILGGFPLPPEAIRVTSGGKWQYRLTKEDLLTVFDVCLEILETKGLPPTRAFQKARQVFEKEREKRVPVDSLVSLICQQFGYSENQERKTKKILIQKLQEGEQKLLPLFDVRPQEILILGVLPEDQKDFVATWTEFIQKEELKKEKPMPINIMLKTWPSLTGFLKEQLGLEKINLRLVSYAVTWLKKEGISIATIRRQIRNRLTTYYRPSPQEQKQLEDLLAIPEKQEELKRILLGKAVSTGKK